MKHNLPERIFLCGFMGAGKSTLGKKLAARLNYSFIDLDEKIEEETGLTIPEIFDTSGEEGFRKKERRVLQTVSWQKTGVIALGGGSLQDEQLLDYLQQQGRLIFIEVPFSIILDRIAGDRNRPMLWGENGELKSRDTLRDELYPLYKGRLRYYKQADAILTADKSQTTDQLVNKLIEKIRNMSSIDVSISLRHQYLIHVGTDLEKQFLSFCSDRYSSDQLIVVMDEKVASFHKEYVKAISGSYFQQVTILEIPEGESSKSVSQWERLVNSILNKQIERGTPLLAVGGGVTGDIAGFVASSVFRGIPLIHMPTSLLAMVDSSIGGKTGLNHKTGKNLIGAFYQPDAVFSDLNFLETLAQKEWVTGMAEIIKYAAIHNPKLFAELEQLTKYLGTPNEKWEEVIRESAGIKTAVVQEDALEAGKRAYLNFGHTFGHALEKAAGYGTLSHGEAVFVGMIAALHFSKNLGHPVDDVRLAPFMPLYKQQMKVLPNNVEELIEVMKTDKKVKDKTIRLVLLNDWGSPYIHNCTDFSGLEESWRYALAKFN